MLARILLGTNSLRTLVAVLLILLLASCGKNVNPTSGVLPSQQVTPSIGGVTPSQQVTPSSMPQSRPVHSISFDVANIHIYSGEGIVCLNYPEISPSNPVGLHGNLVLAKSRLSYDSGEIQQMRTYATAIYGIGSSASPPSTLSWVQGTRVGDVGGRSFASNLLGTGCFGEMDLTNTGKNSILIQSVNMQLTATPIRTDPSYQYKMIDICSLLIGISAGSGGCPPMAGGSDPVFDFFRLKAAPSGSVFTPEQQINNPDYQSGSDIILNPKAQYVLPIIFYFTSLDSLVYSLSPQLLLKKSDGTQQTVPLPQLATTLYFANLSQFPCYTLQGYTFVKLTEDTPNAYCV